jgi:hypothetical protein
MVVEIAHQQDRIRIGSDHPLGQRGKSAVLPSPE